MLNSPVKHLLFQAGHFLSRGLYTFALRFSKTDELSGATHGLSLRHG